MLEFKTIKESEKTHRHINVSSNNEHLGYFMKDGKEYVFCSENRKIEYFRVKNKNEIKKILTKQLNKETVLLRQHFAITKTLN